jgi:hypothetical protein
MHHSYLCQQYAVQQLLSLLLVLLDVSILVQASDEGQSVCVIHEQIMLVSLRSTVDI